MSADSEQALVGRLRAEAERASSTLVELADHAALAAHLAQAADGGPVVLAPRLVQRQPALRPALEDAGVAVRVPADDDADLAAAVADAPVGVVAGELAVAESGSVLVAEHALADRVVSMLCRRLVQVVPREAVVASLDDAAGWLAQHASGQASFASLMTGPSRSADIERSLTIGVQGPDAVDVVVLG